MNEFSRHNGDLYAEGVPVRDLVDRYGTPLYVYSQNHLRTQYRELARAMSPVSPLICFSVKANSNAGVIRTLVAEGAGADIVSGGELFRALRAGVEPSKIVFAGVGKTRDEIDYALSKDILFFTVESEPEVERIAECAKRLGVTARVAFRVNPDVDPQTHVYVNTGKKESKFGLDADRTVRACEAASRLPNLEMAGLQMHIGSQILSAEPFGGALSKLSLLIRDLKLRFPTIRYMDIGGGIGIQYKSDQNPLSPTAYAESVLPVLSRLGLSVVLEPGRYLVGNGGILVCRVQYVKDNAFRKFVVVDAGMNDLIRPPLYDAYHEVVPVGESLGTMRADLVGPICESGDFLAVDRDLPAVREGDLLAVLSAGAYGFVMASNYNSRPRPAEVMVDGDKAVIARERETWEDLVKREV
jgi:diaminopimelate decarboxylase